MTTTRKTTPPPEPDEVDEVQGDEGDEGQEQPAPVAEPTFTLEQMLRAASPEQLRQAGLQALDEPQPSDLPPAQDGQGDFLLSLEDGSTVRWCNPQVTRHNGLAVLAVRESIQ